MMSKKAQILLNVVLILSSIILPIFILNIFHMMFATFYTKGFLTGLGHLLVCGLMVILNIVTSLILIQWQRNTQKEDITVAILIFFMVSLILQVILNILIENPFVDPPLPNFT